MNLSGSIKFNKCAVSSLIAIVIIIIYLLSSSNFNSKPLHSSSSKKINLRKLLIGAVQASKLGGKEILKVSSQLDFETKSKGRTIEGENEFFTAADVLSHCAIGFGLLRIFPNLNLISEEDVQKKNCPENLGNFDLDPTFVTSANLPDIAASPEDITVWIDPLDATKEFTEKLFHYVSVMICVAFKGEPIIGVIHFPFSQKTYWSWKNYASSENLANIKGVIILISTFITIIIYVQPIFRICMKKLRIRL